MISVVSGPLGLTLNVQGHLFVNKGYMVFNNYTIKMQIPTCYQTPA